MKNLSRPVPLLALSAALAGLAATWTPPARAVDLLERYPTTLTQGDVNGEHARSWDVTSEDLYSLSRFSFEVGENLKVEIGAATLAIGHSSDGAVWAIVVPAKEGKLTRPGADPEEIAHLWLRFHPKEINRLFPPDTVSTAEKASMVAGMRRIARVKMNASFQAGGRAMIPEPKDMSVDADVKSGHRRFFVVDTQAGTAKYVSAFESHIVPANAPAIVSTSPANGATGVDPDLAEITVTFDQDMDKGFSWTGGGPQFPPSADGARPHWQDKRTCVMPVKLESGHHYRVGINAPSFHNFRSAGGVPADISSISFTTK